MSEITLKYDPRKEQDQMFEFTKSSIEDGKKYILLNSPVGTGKSYAAIMISKWYREKFGTDKKVTILTGSKLLQDQYINDFPFIRNLKGQSNYWCDYHKTDCKTGKELNTLIKRKCDYCPYDTDKQLWLGSFISLTNFHLFNTYSLYFPEIIKARNTSLLIIDEAHDFEGVFNNFLSIVLNQNILKRCGFDQRYLENIDILISRIKKIEHIIKFINEKFLDDLFNLKDEYIQLLVDETDMSTKNVYSNYINKIDEQISKFENFAYYYNGDKENWTIDINQNKKTLHHELTIQPIWSNDYLKKTIWDSYDVVILMSGTILDKEMFSYVNGLEEDITSYIEIDTTFPVENRKVYYLKGAGKMTYKEKKETFKNQIPLINKILKKHSKDKGIIHTGNYEITNWLKEQNNDRFVFHETNDRSDKYQYFLISDKPLVMVSPSMGTGISLDDDLGRFGIVLKIPYPNISSNQIKSRIESNKNWYNWYTATQVIQSLGRIVRSSTDYGMNYILDESFSNILSDGYIPHYVIESIKILK